jgi:phage gpG-like protein
MAGVHIRGVQKVKLRLRLIGDESVAAMGVATRRVLEQVARQERTLLSLGYHPHGTPTGSRPGQPPWRISGDLSRSVDVHGPVLRGSVSPRWVGKVGAGAVYARIQELGGWAGQHHRTYLPARPHLTPAWLIVAPNARIVYEHELRRALKL